jgi:hypothetical protein
MVVTNVGPTGTGIVPSPFVTIIRLPAYATSF